MMLNYLPNLTHLEETITKGISLVTIAATTTIDTMVITKTAMVSL